MKFEVRFLLQRLFFIGFWLATCTGFVSDLFWGPYEVSPLTTISQLVVDVIVLFLAFCTVRKKIDIILIISLLTIAAISGFIVNDDSIVVWLNGIRYFFPVMFLPPILRYFWATEYRHDLFVKSLDKQLYIFLWLQVPTVLFQFFMYGAGDFVGGTMGGWFSGILSFSIYYTSFYLLNKRIDRNNILQPLYKNWIYIFLLFPTFLNETKISFGLIIAYFVLLLPIDRKYLIRLTFLTPLIVILVGIGSTFYFSTVTGSEKFELSQEFFENYLTADLNNIEGAVEYAEKNYEETFDIPRFAKLELVLMVFNEQPGHNLFGFGLSLYRHGKIVEAADFYNEYDWLMKGTSPQMMSSALQLGIIGSIWYIIFFISLFFIKPYPYIKRNYNMQVYFFLAFVILLFYADYWQYPNFSHVLFLFLFLSWEKDKPVAIQSNVV
ncbi:MAG: hypothetical protein IKX63_01240 [Muribaculaceae bacterium]|nr:hypothetical protein [Muribaculaceae bacterium]